MSVVKIINDRTYNNSRRLLENSGIRFLYNELIDILRDGKINTLFQPIVSLKNSYILGYEALSRGPKNHVLEFPDDLFYFARKYNKLWELELLCRIKALENFSSYKGNSKIFINVDPNIINDEKFKKGFTKEFLKTFNIDAESIVFEITENNLIKDYNSFKKLINHYKDQGYKIAIDDTGSGYSGLKLITEIHPHYIKLDMSLIRNIDKDGTKYSLIKAFHDFCEVTNIKLIAEGIETEGEFNTLIELGIDYGQGYFIKKPNSDLLSISSKIKSYTFNQNKIVETFSKGTISTVAVGHIHKSNIFVDSYCIGSKVLDIFENNPKIFALPVVDDKKVVGLMMKDKFYAKLGTKYGFSLYINRPVKLLMDKNPLIIDYHTKIDIASKLAMNRSTDKLYDYLIITNKDEYSGIVTVKDLLEKSTQLAVNYAKHLNPLSGLPGNMTIENKLSSYVANDLPFTVLYIDIDNFKVYNDVYGFENGDKMIQLIANILKSCISDNCVDDNFIGHIGGDDFVIGVEGYNCDKICVCIIDTFKKSIKSLYTDEDYERGFVIAKNRHGVKEKFNLVSLSIAGITNKNTSFKDIYKLAEHAVNLKKKCKEIWDNCYLIE